MKNYFPAHKEKLNNIAYVSVSVPALCSYLIELFEPHVTLWDFGSQFISKE
jgi:hypothetical protein